jgi:hypothetical protein
MVQDSILDSGSIVGGPIDVEVETAYESNVISQPRPPSPPHPVPVLQLLSMDKNRVPCSSLCLG